MTLSLQGVYEDAVRTWRTLRGDHPSISAPHLVCPPVEYVGVQTRLMIVGQETLGWGEEVSPNVSESDAVTELRACYRTFDLGLHYRPSPFWIAANQIFRALNPTATTRAFIWSNLVKMDDAKRRPSPALEDAVADLGLLQAEVREFSPDVVVFFTGPRYDGRLMSTFPGARLNSRGRGAALVEHPALPSRTFRTYHPAYLRRSHQWAVLDDLVRWCEVA